MGLSLALDWWLHMLFPQIFAKYCYSVRCWKCQLRGEEVSLASVLTYCWSLRRNLELYHASDSSRFSFRCCLAQCRGFRNSCTFAWPVFNETGMSDRCHLNCTERRLIRNLYMGQRVKLCLYQGKSDSVEIGRGVRQGCCMSPIYLTYMGNIEWKKH